MVTGDDLGAKRFGGWSAQAAGRWWEFLAANPQVPVRQTTNGAFGAVPSVAGPTDCSARQGKGRALPNRDSSWGNSSRQAERESELDGRPLAGHGTGVVTGGEGSR